MFHNTEHLDIISNKLQNKHITSEHRKKTSSIISRINILNEGKNNMTKQVSK